MLKATRNCLGTLGLGQAWLVRRERETRRMRGEAGQTESKETKLVLVLVIRPELRPRDMTGPPGLLMIHGMKADLIEAKYSSGLSPVINKTNLGICCNISSSFATASPASSEYPEIKGWQNCERGTFILPFSLPTWRPWKTITEHLLG